MKIWTQFVVPLEGKVKKKEEEEVEGESERREGKGLFSVYKSFGGSWKAWVTTTFDRCTLSGSLQPLCRSEGPGCVEGCELQTKCGIKRWRSEERRGSSGALCWCLWRTAGTDAEAAHTIKKKKKKKKVYKRYIKIYVWSVVPIWEPIWGGFVFYILIYEKDLFWNQSHISIHDFEIQYMI